MVQGAVTYTIPNDVMFRMLLQGGPKRFYFGDNFGNSDFNHSFTVTSRNLCRVNVKFFHPPHLDSFLWKSEKWCVEKSAVWHVGLWNQTYLFLYANKTATLLVQLRCECCITMAFLPYSEQDIRDEWQQQHMICLLQGVGPPLLERHDMGH